MVSSAFPFSKFVQASFTTLIIGSASVLSAQMTIDVTTTVDENNGSGGEGISLREAIIMANSSPGFDSIFLMPGETYRLEAQSSGPRSLSINSSMEIVGRFAPGDNPSVIDAQTESRIFDISSPSQIQVTLAGIDFINGRPESGATDFGGAIFIGPDPEVLIEDCGFFDNDADGPSMLQPLVSRGGAIYMNAGSGLLEMIRCEFVGNSADEGAAIYLQNAPSGQIISTRFGLNEDNIPQTVVVEDDQNFFLIDQNWWGRNSGPLESPALLSGNIFVDNWIGMTLTANPVSPQGIGSSLELEAGLTEIRDMNGVIGDLPEFESVRDGIPVIWIESRGGTRRRSNLLGVPAEPGLSAFPGRASNIIDVLTEVGTETESATIDGQTLSLDLVYGDDQGMITDPAGVTLFDVPTRSADLFAGLAYSGGGTADTIRMARLQILNPLNGMNESFTIPANAGIDPGNIVVDNDGITITQTASSATYISALTQAEYVNNAGTINGEDRNIVLTLFNDPITSYTATHTVTFPDELPTALSDLWMISGSKAN